ncbi:MAG TPA: hypothetical protein VMT18_16305, partial [Planctomycetota bacterium]|nr:hypothetical protein [Planctomycetota bacterium]
MHARRRIVLGTALTLLFCPLGACRASAPRLPDDPALALEQVEQRLLEARSVRCFSELTAEGALAAELSSEHQLAPDGRARVRVRGAFDGREVDVVFESDGAVMRMVGAGSLREREALPDVFAGFVLGFTRMGWMHNAAALAAGGLPEGCDGGVRTWLAASDVRMGDEFELNGVP